MCPPFQEYAQTPHRLMLDLQDDSDCNHKVYVDVFYVSGAHVLHIADEESRALAEP